MTAVLITNSLLSKLKPENKAYDVRDNRLKGFIVRVQPSGSMSYVVQYARGKRANLGKVGVLTPVQAREKAIKILGDYANGLPPNQSREKQKEVPTLRSFLEKDYGPWVKAHNVSGVDAIKAIYRHFNHLMDIPLDQVKAQQIDKWRTKQIESAAMKKNTINRTVTPLRSAITKAVEWGVIEQHGLAGLKILKYDDTRIRYLEEDEKRKLFEHLKKRELQIKNDRISANAWRKVRGYKLYPEIQASEFADHLLPMFILALNTGIRKGELLQLKRSDINLKKGTLFIAKSKNYLSRYVPLNKTASSMLETWMKQTKCIGSVYLFPSPLDSTKPITSIKKAWGKAVDDAGITNLRWHDLRHDFASNLVMKEVSLYVVQKLLGHKKMDQTMKYAHLASDFIAESVARLDA